MMEDDENYRVEEYEDQYNNEGQENENEELNN